MSSLWCFVIGYYHRKLTYAEFKPYFQGLDLSKSERFSHALVQAIKKERESQKISQYSLAKLSGISQTMIHHMEGGKRNPTVITVHALAVALGLSMGELIELAETLLVNKRTEKL